MEEFKVFEISCWGVAVTGVSNISNLRCCWPKSCRSCGREPLDAGLAATPLPHWPLEGPFLQPQPFPSSPTPLALFAMLREWRPGLAWRRRRTEVKSGRALQAALGARPTSGGIRCGSFKGPSGTKKIAESKLNTGSKFAT